MEDDTSQNEIVASGRSHFTADDVARILADIRMALESDSLTSGPLNQRFENQLSRALHGYHAATVSSGTTAIEATLLALGIGRDAEVVVQANTFVGTASAVMAVGADVVFVDCEEDTLGPTADAVRSAFSDRTRAVIVTHLGGVINPYLPQIRKLCEDHGISLVEDAAQALGSKLHGLPIGSWSIAATLSFYPRKIVTCGEGGAVISRTKRVTERVQLLRDQGRAPNGVHLVRGSNWRLTELQAALGCAQLDRLDEIVERRSHLAQIYQEYLAHWSPTFPPGVTPNWYKFWVILPRTVSRQDFTSAMARKGMLLPGPLGGHEEPAHSYPPYRGCRREGSLIKSEEFARAHACLPLYPDLADEEAVRVAKQAHAILSDLT